MWQLIQHFWAKNLFNFNWICSGVYNHTTLSAPNLIWICSGHLFLCPLKGHSQPHLLLWHHLPSRPMTLLNMTDILLFWAFPQDWKLLLAKNRTNHSLQPQAEDNIGTASSSSSSSSPSSQPEIRQVSLNLRTKTSYQEWQLISPTPHPPIPVWLL